MNRNPWDYMPLTYHIENGIDDLQFEESGTPIEFSIEADKEVWYYITAITFNLNPSN